jgi:hypothetical protein
LKYTSGLGKFRIVGKSKFLSVDMERRVLIPEFLLWGFLVSVVMGAVPELGSLQGRLTENTNLVNGPIVSSFYTIMAGAVSDGALTTETLRDASTTSARITDGSISNVDLALLSHMDDYSGRSRL